MTETKIIDVKQDIYDENDRLAREINRDLSAKKIFTVNVMGAPGTGKTSTLLKIIKGLQPLKCFVIEGDIESDLDTQTLTKLGLKAFQINTKGACHLDSPILKTALSKVSLEKESCLFIENIGNLVCPAEFMIGEHVKMLVVSVTDGSDKPYKYPLAFEKADIILLNKCDLKPYVDFDPDFFYKGVKALNKTVPVFEVSGKTGQGFEKAVDWIKERRSRL